MRPRQSVLVPAALCLFFTHAWAQRPIRDVAGNNQLAPIGTSQPEPRAAGGGRGSGAGDAGDCTPTFSEEPAAGKWKGEVKFDYKMSIPDTPGFAMLVDWRGRIALELKRRPDERVGRSSCGLVKSPPSFASAPAAGCNVDGTPLQLLSRDDETPPELTGTTDVTMQMNLSDVGDGSELTQDVASQRPASLSNEAGLDREGKRLDAVLLVGTPSLFQFAGGFAARDDAVTVAGESQLNGGGTASVRGTVRGELSGTIGADIAGGRIEERVDVVDSDGQRHKGEASAAVPGLDQQRRPLFRLLVDERSCGEIKGRVESEDLVNEARGGGMQLTPVRSEWSATLEERDLPLEQAAQRYADAPLLPMSAGDPEGTWTNWQREWESYSALRGPSPSDYVLCVLEPAHEKIVAASATALRVLLDSPAHAAEAAKLRQWRLVSVIEGFGSSLECPVAREATESLFGTQR